jgi:prepilin signal peptidase PulO-like enzyme (type II secretory pathway)
LADHVVADGRLRLPYQGVVAPLAVVLAALAFTAFPRGASAGVAALLAGTLVVLSAIDIQRGIIPNRIVLPATGLVLLVRIAFFPDHALEWIAASILGGLVLFLPRLLTKTAMGMGDVKMAMLIGAGLGWGVVLALPVAFMCSFPAALIVVVRRGLSARRTSIPFGPFLALGALIVLFTPYVLGLPTG